MSTAPCRSWWRFLADVVLAVGLGGGPTFGGA
jgi:hypothetical protein